MTERKFNPRTPEVEVDSMFFDRWSPRAFSSEPVSEKQLQSLFEAARWAPSCYNEQPWLFAYAVKEEDRNRFAEALMEKNRQWAAKAPVLLFVLARKNFTQNGKPNRHHGFDAGAAWVSLAFQARRLGLYTHAMAGFSQKKAHVILGTKEEEYEIMAAVALGYLGEADELPDDFRAMEGPNERKPLDEIAVEGRIPSPQG